jgi:hypothetical protein
MALMAALKPPSRDCGSEWDPTWSSYGRFTRRHPSLVQTRIIDQIARIQALAMARRRQQWLPSQLWNVRIELQNRSAAQLIQVRHRLGTPPELLEAQLARPARFDRFPPPHPGRPGITPEAVAITPLRAALAPGRSVIRKRRRRRSRSPRGAGPAEALWHQQIRNETRYEEQPHSSSPAPAWC